MQPARATPVIKDKKDADSSPAGKLKILVVDDNHDAALSLALLLESMGYEVHTAFDGPEAMTAATELRPDLMFLDIGLPGLSGYDVARQLRDDPANLHTQIVALSGYGTAQDRALSSKAGFDLHVVKPIDHQNLERILHSRMAR